MNGIVFVQEEEDEQKKLINENYDSKNELGIFQYFCVYQYSRAPNSTH